jgi:hypothetical protein
LPQDAVSENDDEETAIQQELPQDAVSEKIEGFGNKVGHIQQQQPSVDLSKAAEEASGEGEKTQELAADVDVVICIDVDAETDDLQVFYIYLNLNFIYGLNI